MYKHLIAGTFAVTVALVAGGCSDDGSADAPVAVGADDGADPATVLQDAIDRTLAAPSMVITFETSDADGHSTVVVHFVAPDRYVVVDGGPDGPTGQVQIGSTLYLPTSDGRFNLVTTPDGREAESLLATLAGLREATVLAVDGDAFTVEAGDGASGVVHIVDGVVTDFVLDVVLTPPPDSDLGDHPLTITMSFADLGAALDVSAPPADLVDELLVDPETGCAVAPDGPTPSDVYMELFEACLAVGGDPSSLDMGNPPVHLPVPATVVDSTLQVRAVVGPATACEEGTGQPDPALEIARQGPDGRCLALAPAEVEIERAEVFSTFPAEEGQAAIEIVLDDADAAALDALVARFQLGELALVFDGTLVLVAEVTVPSFGGTVVLTFADVDLAGSIAASLERP
jgi:hypothetical protein